MRKFGRLFFLLGIGLGIGLGITRRGIEAQAHPPAFAQAPPATLLTWSTDGTARLWDAATGAELMVLRHADWVVGAAWNSDRTRLLTWSRDGRARLWDAATGAELFTLHHEDNVLGARWTP